ncbi:MAG TPA: YIP1 family protein [Candidatus Acidoferrum sp.]|nr:YIP1 family protein [Candidatus Acidoferrum sp.]
METTPVPNSLPQPPTSEPAPKTAISPLGRIAGMFFSPQATFEDIVRAPSWILPLVLILVLSLVAVIALNSHFNWRDYASGQIEKNPRTAKLTPEQKQQQVEISAKYSPIVAYVAGTILPVLGLLVITLVLWGAYNLLANAGASFKLSWAIVTHALVPASIVGTLLFITVLFLKPAGTFDIENPVATNLAVFFPDDSAKWLVALGKNIDLLEFWKILLLAIGFAALNPKKLKGGKSLTIVLSLFLLYVVIRVGGAFIFS